MYSDVTDEEGLLHFAEDIEADAIVLGTHRRTGIGHLLAGSLSENMVNHSKTPVITFPLVPKVKSKDTTKEDLSTSS